MGHFSPVVSSASTANWTQESSGDLVICPLARRKAWWYQESWRDKAFAEEIMQEKCMQRLYRIHFTVLETSGWEVPKSLSLRHMQFLALFPRAVPRSFRLKCPPPHWWAAFSYAVISVTVAAFQQYRIGKHIYYRFMINRPVQEVFAKHMKEGKKILGWFFFGLI